MNELDSPDIEAQMQSVRLAEIEPLYWILEDALYENKQERASNVFSFLCAVAKHRNDLLKQALHPEQCDRLQQIAYEIIDGKGYVEYQPIKIEPARQPIAVPFKKERDLEEHLVQNPQLLEKALSRDGRIRIRGRQVKTDFGYACDIVAESDSTFYPIELKIRQGQHAVVSQIEKYCFYFYRQLRFDKYKSIQGVVIANGFDDFSINELRRKKMRVFTIQPREGDIELVEIN